MLVLWTHPVKQAAEGLIVVLYLWFDFRSDLWRALVPDQPQGEVEPFEALVALLCGLEELWFKNPTEVLQILTFHGIEEIIIDRGKLWQKLGAEPANLGTIDEVV